MPTTTVKTIGTTGDYTSLASWEAACPANLVTADEIWQGQVQNQEFVVAGAVLTIAGQVTDATRYVELTTVAGASFADNANKLTNALKYNASNGAGIRSSSGYNPSTVTISTNYTRISKIQVFANGSPGGAAIGVSGSVLGVRLDQMILVGGSSGTYFAASATGTITNCLAICTTPSRSNSAGFISYGANVTYLNCTAVGYSDVVPSATSRGFWVFYTASTIKNCAGFGFNVFSSGSGGAPSGNNNASDKTISFGSANQASLTYADQFIGTTSGAPDFRESLGATLLTNGVDLSGSGVTVDIVGTSRSVPYDIGAWQVNASPPIGTDLFSPSSVWI